MSSDSETLTVEQIVDFLEKIGGLPSSDISALDISLFDCINEDHEIVALGGIEVLGPYALLRSVAVLPAHRGKGLARKMVNKLERKAADKKVSKMFLLTTDASTYFEKLGYVVHDRELVPEEISKTSQFSDLCPSSSTLMSKSL